MWKHVALASEQDQLYWRKPPNLRDHIFQVLLRQYKFAQFF